MANFRAFYRALRRTATASVFFLCFIISGVYGADEITLDLGDNVNAIPYGTIMSGDMCYLPGDNSLGPGPGCDNPLTADCSNGGFFVGYFKDLSGADVRYVDENGCLTQDGLNFCDTGGAGTWYAVCANNKITLYPFHNTGMNPVQYGQQIYPSGSLYYDANGFYFNIGLSNPVTNCGVPLPSNISNPVSLNFMGYYDWEGNVQYVDENGCLTQAGLDFVQNHTGLHAWYGRWENVEYPGEYTLKYDCGGVQGASTSMTGNPAEQELHVYGEPYTLSYGTCSLPGYHQTGFTCTNGLGNQGLGDYEHATNYTITYWPVWDIENDSDCTIGWEANNCQLNYSCNTSFDGYSYGSGTPQPQTVTFDQNFTAYSGGVCTPPPGVQNNHYFVFDGWDCSYTSLNPSLLPTNLDSGQTYPWLVADCSGKVDTCYAKWRMVKGFTVTYNCNNGNLGTEPVDSGLYDQGDLVNVLANTCYAPMGKVFSGWNCGGNNVNANGSFNITTDTTCTAVWNDIANPCETPEVIPNYYLIVSNENLQLNGSPVVGQQSFTSFSYGSVETIGACSSASGTPVGYGYFSWASPVHEPDYGENCWCTVNSITGFSAGVGLQNSHRWVFVESFNDVNDCESNCASACSAALQTNINVRRSLYTVVDCKSPVIYNCGTGASGNAPIDQNSPYSLHETVNVLSGAASCVPPTGYSTFEYWNCESDAALSWNNDHSSFEMGYWPVTCTASWSPNTIYLNWLLNGEGSSLISSNPTMCKYGKVAGEPDSITPINDPTRDGYKFTGWTISHQ